MDGKSKTVVLDIKQLRGRRSRSVAPVRGQHMCHLCMLGARDCPYNRDPSPTGIRRVLNFDAKECGSTDDAPRDPPGNLKRLWQSESGVLFKNSPPRRGTKFDIYGIWADEEAREADRSGRNSGAVELRGHPKGYSSATFLPVGPVSPFFRGVPDPNEPQNLYSDVYDGAVPSFLEEPNSELEPISDILGRFGYWEDGAGEDFFGELSDDITYRFFEGI